ncbi:hypothetical protein [Corynebacterium cystitidis]|nr:hypothetical protein [Corynebacterium cystitidis]
MNLDAIIESAVAFSSDGIGAILLKVLTALYDVFYPSNAEAATPIEIPA